jgi:hypothetical protein
MTHNAKDSTEPFSAICVLNAFWIARSTDREAFTESADTGKLESAFVPPLFCSDRRM